MLPKFDQSTMGQREPEYLAWAALCVAMDVQSYVELGTGSAHYMTRARIPRVASIDINNVPDRHNPHEERGVIYRRGSSHDSALAQEVITSLGGSVDAVFIDADHEGEAPMRDFDLWYPHARKLIGFHDIQIPHIMQNVWPVVSLHRLSVKLIGCDIESAMSWQGPDCPWDGVLAGGGIGVIFK